MAAKKGHNTTIGFNAGSGALVTIADVVSISGPSITIPTIDSTNLTSTSRTFLTSLPDNGEVTFTIQYDHDETTHAGLEALAVTPDDSVNWGITFSDADTATFSGALVGFNINGMEIDGLVQAEITVKISGDVTFA